MSPEIITENNKAPIVEILNKKIWELNDFNALRDSWLYQRYLVDEILAKDLIGLADDTEYDVLKKAIDFMDTFSWAAMEKFPAIYWRKNSIKMKIDLKNKYLDRLNLVVDGFLKTRNSFEQQFPKSDPKVIEIVMIKTHGNLSYGEQILSSLESRLGKMAKDQKTVFNHLFWKFLISGGFHSKAYLSDSPFDFHCIFLSENDLNMILDSITFMSERIKLKTLDLSSKNNFWNTVENEDIFSEAKEFYDLYLTEVVRADYCAFLIIFFKACYDKIVNFSFDTLIDIYGLHIFDPEVD